MRLQEQLKVLLKKETFNPFLTYACFYCLYHVSSTLTYIFRNHMSKLTKNKTNYLFYFETFFYISKWKDRFAKSYRCCEVWRREQGKTIYTSNHISKKCQLLYLAKQSLPRTVFICLFFFSLVLLWERLWLILALSRLHYFM